MADLRRARAFPRIMLLFLLLVGLTVGGALWFDVLGLIDITDTISPLIRLFGGEGRRDPAAPADSPVLLDAARLAKDQEALALRERELEDREAELAAREADFVQRLAELTEREQAQADRENSFNERVAQYDNRRANLEQISRDLTAMPPANAVAIMEGYDDVFLIDVLRVTEELAQQSGAASLVPFWLSQLPDDRVAELQRKMALVPAES